MISVDRIDLGRRCWLAAMSGGDEPSYRPAEAPGEQPQLLGRRVLVVEDESLIALLIADALEEAGALVVGPCYTLAECFRAATGEEVDAAILDVDLAGQDVFPVAEELERRGIPFAFHTGHGERAELQARFGDVPICRKPSSMEDLLAVLARITGPAATN